MNRSNVQWIGVTSILLACACKRDAPTQNLVPSNESASVASPKLDATVVHDAGPPDTCRAMFNPSWKMSNAKASTGAACAQIEAAHRAVVTHVTASFGSAGDAEAAFAKGLLNEFRCVAGPTGAWAVTFDTLALDPKVSSVTVTGKLTLGYYDLVGTRLASVIPAPPFARSEVATTAEDNMSGDVSHGTSADLVAYDWSGDGRPEAFLLLTRRGGEHGLSQRGSAWTFDGRAVVEYAPAKGRLPLAALDVDGDGRLDLVTTPFAQAVDASRDWWFNGPFFVAHSLANGTFSANDDLAKKSALCSCSDRPSPLVVRDELDDVAYTVACARVWNSDTQTITTALHSSCNADASTERTACTEAPIIERIASQRSAVLLP